MPDQKHPYSYEGCNADEQNESQNIQENDDLDRLFSEAWEELKDMSIEEIAQIFSWATPSKGVNPSVAAGILKEI
ncbi:hypothetical protein GQX73_g3814 [Xylaria multiplex]|uniref:Uncharacterized protein n=1 Tax=Xylaria multiplex TaxID=323545 RepID=A0A7C8IQF9_9PEZI|nr:hypothetical protein GQX73_g3814 [Xylaria multiplex]